MRCRKLTQGAKANKNGGILEEQVRPILNRNGYTEVDKGEIPPSGQKSYQVHAHVGNTVYGSKRYVDFLITEPNGTKRCIECKYQESAGSVDEKFPFLNDNIKSTKIPTYIIHGGGGQKPGSIKWLKEQSGAHNTLRAVTDLNEFTAIVNNDWKVKYETKESL